MRPPGFAILLKDGINLRKTRFEEEKTDASPLSAETKWGKTPDGTPKSEQCSLNTEQFWAGLRIEEVSHPGPQFPAGEEDT